MSLFPKAAVGGILAFTLLRLSNRRDPKAVRTVRGVKRMLLVLALGIGVSFVLALVMG